MMSAFIGAAFREIVSSRASEAISVFMVKMFWAELVTSGSKSFTQATARWNFNYSGPGRFKVPEAAPTSAGRFGLRGHIRGRAPIVRSLREFSAIGHRFARAGNGARLFRVAI